MKYTILTFLPGGTWAKHAKPTHWVHGIYAWCQRLVVDTRQIMKSIVGASLSVCTLLSLNWQQFPHAHPRVHPHPKHMHTQTGRTLNTETPITPHIAASFEHTHQSWHLTVEGQSQAQWDLCRKGVSIVWTERVGQGHRSTNLLHTHSNNHGQLTYARINTNRLIATRTHTLSHSIKAHWQAL